MDIIYGLNGAHLLVLALIVGLWVGYKIVTSPTYDDLTAAEEREAQRRRARFYAVPTPPSPPKSSTCAPKRTNWTA